MSYAVRPVRGIAKIKEITFDRSPEKSQLFRPWNPRCRRNSDLDPDHPRQKMSGVPSPELTEYRLYEDLREAGEWYNKSDRLASCVSHIVVCKVVRRGGPLEVSFVVESFLNLKRETLIRTGLGSFQRKLAIATRCLEETSQQQIRRPC